MVYLNMPNNTVNSNSIISELLGSHNFTLQCRLDVIDVLSDLRPASRLIVRKKNEAEALARVLVESGGHIKVGKYSFKQTVNSSGYVDYLDNNSSSELNQEDYVSLYFSCDENLAIDAFNADYTKDDKIFGRSLGYPTCCIDMVIKKGKVPALADCFKLYANDGQYEPLTWPVASILDAALIPHYPCKPDCKKSIKIAESRMDLLYQYGRTNDINRIQKALTRKYQLSRNGIISISRSNNLRDIFATAVPNRDIHLIKY